MPPFVSIQAESVWKFLQFSNNLCMTHIRNWLPAFDPEAEPTAPACCIDPTLIYFVPLTSIHWHVFCFFSLCRKRGGKGLRPTQITCSFNELMNNCWRATVAIIARSSVCRALLQDLCSCPQLIPQATTTQTAWLTPIWPPPLLPVFFSLQLVPHFSWDPSLLCWTQRKQAVMPAHVVAEPHLSEFPGNLVCICLALTLSQKN